MLLSRVRCQASWAVRGGSQLPGASGRCWGVGADNRDSTSIARLLLGTTRAASRFQLLCWICSPGRSELASLVALAGWTLPPLLVSDYWAFRGRYRPHRWTPTSDSRERP